MSSYPQAPCRSSLDSTIAVKMLKPEGKVDKLSKTSFISSRNRKHIRVSKVIVHKNFSTHMNDIALLKLGKETHYLLKDIRD